MIPFRIFALLLAACATLCARPVHAASFTVDTLLDGPNEHDANLADGACRSSRNQCSLRAAIEQANALAGPHEIRFSVAGTIAPAVEGALPGLSRAISLRGDTAPGYATGAADIGDAPPVLWLDGTFAPDGTSGLVIHASGGSVRALGIVAMPVHGIDIRAGASAVEVRDSWIGVRANGSAAGNGEAGIAVGAANVRIGRIVSGLSAQGLGNLISANAIGIRVRGNNIQVFGNRIGTRPDGRGPMGNTTHGIVLDSPAANFARIGRVLTGFALGNLIAANEEDGIRVLGGEGGAIQSNTFGLVQEPSGDSGGATAISVRGPVRDLLIGGAEPGEGNQITTHDVGIRIGELAAGPADIHVRGNRVGLGPGTRGSGIVAGTCDTCSLSDNAVRNVGNHGIELAGDAWHAYRNAVGFDATGPGAAPGMIDGCGILVYGDGTVLGPLPGAPVGADGSPSDGNRIGHVQQYGICVFGHGTYIASQSIGVDADGAPAPNGGGILLHRDVVDSVVTGSTIANNAGSGIAIGDGGVALGNLFRVNAIVANGGPAIDLGEDGHDLNDVGDADEAGPHRRINHPILSDAVWFLREGRPFVRVTVSHEASVGRVGFPLFVDLYVNASPLREAEHPARAVVLTGAGQVVNGEVPLRAGTRGGFLTATASSMETGTSELSPSLAFGVPSLFRDGFE